MTELKPCPWCGSEMVTVRNETEGVVLFWHGDFREELCPIAEPFVIITDDEEYARKAWNRRLHD